MAKTLTDRVKRMAGIGAFLVGSLGASVPSGCTPAGYALFGAASQHNAVMATIPRNAAAWSAMSSLGNSTASIEAAKKYGHNNPNNNTQLAAVSQPMSDEEYDARLKELDARNKRERTCLYGEELARRMREKSPERYNSYKRDLKQSAPEIYKEYVERGLILE